MIGAVEWFWLPTNETEVTSGEDGAPLLNRGTGLDIIESLKSEL